MQPELIETGSELRLRTDTLELGWSRENGALIVLSLRGGSNVLGHGPPRPGLDVAIGAPGDWTAGRSFLRYLSHRVEPAPVGVTVAVNVGLGPLKICDRYTIRGALVERRVELEHVGLDDLRLFGVRLVVPNARVGNPQTCRLEAPANSVRPRVALAVAAAQRRNVLPRRFFAPGVRGGGALEPVPTQGPGLLALHGELPSQTLLCWYEAAGEAALPFVEGAEGWLDAVALCYEVGLVSWLRPRESLSIGAQWLLLTEEPWEQARARFLALLQPGQPRVAWVGDEPLYLSSSAEHGGLAGLAASVPALAELGVGALALRPLHLTAGGQTLDFERFAPELGDATGLHALVEAAHGAGMRVILDLALQGCAAESRYLTEHPDWFARDESGAFVIGQPRSVPAVSAHPGVGLAPGCYSFDWHNEDLQHFLLSWAVSQLDSFGLDGFRAVAPYSPALSWSRRPPLRAGDGALNPLAWLTRLRAQLATRSPEPALLATLAGPAFGTLCDGVYDYQTHLMFVHAALGRMSGHELADYLGDLPYAAPAGAVRICFMESHDTCELNPLADGLRGSRISRMLQAAMVLCGFVPSLWAGQELGDEPFFRALLGLWRDEPVLRRGLADFAAARCALPTVLCALREYQGRRLLCLMHTGPCQVSTSVSLPGGAPARPPQARFALGPFAAEAAAGGLRLELAPFSTYCLELGV